MPDDLPFIDPVDDCEWLPARELFRRLGFEPLPPSAVDDFQRRGRLWEFIYALASRRFWLSNTNHTGDRELYAWLHDVWFNQAVADIPPEAEWNTRIDVTEYAEDHSALWLRFYAADEEREQWALDFPEDAIPPREDPPFDRDRWLPEPFYPPNASDSTGDEFPCDEQMDDCAAETARSEDDPLGLEAVDAAIEANQRRQREQREHEEREAKGREQLAAITGGESEGWQRPIQQVQRAMSLPPPDELTDDTLHAKLWELLHSLACTGFYVLHTNHLSDRELYADLWHHGLRDEALLPGKIRTGGWYHDVLGSWAEDDVRLWLRFYATDGKRDEHARDWPNDPLPPKEPAPFNRDWRLPKGPIP